MSGGWNSRRYYSMNSVEAYDYYENKWTYLPDMNEKRCDHTSVSMGNKMFVIGGYNTSNCEVFDGFSRRFTSIKSLMKNDRSYFHAVSVGKNIVVLNYSKKYSEQGKLYVYDVVNDEYSAFDRENCENLGAASCVKYFSH